MSDFIPNPPNPERDPRDFDRYYEPAASKGLGLVIGVLVAIALVAGLMFFTGPRDRTEIATVPDRPMTAPADTTRTPAIPPAAPANPAPRQQ